MFLQECQFKQIKIAVNFHDNKNLDVNKKYVLAFDKFKSHIGPLAGIHAAISHCIENSRRTFSIWLLQFL